MNQFLHPFLIGCDLRRTAGGERISLRPVGFHDGESLEAHRVFRIRVKRDHDMVSVGSVDQGLRESFGKKPFGIVFKNECVDPAVFQKRCYRLKNFIADGV